MNENLDRLLAQEAPLDRSEVEALEGWMEALREDIATFGATAEDIQRMGRIRIKIQSQAS